MKTEGRRDVPEGTPALMQAPLLLLDALAAGTTSDFGP